MSTRAVIAYTKGDGRWKGVWNNWSGHTQHLGQALINRVAVLEGDLVQLCRRWIEGCPEGWSSFEKGERGHDDMTWTGGFRDGKVTFDEMPDAHYLYLFDLPARGLLAFEVRRGECAPFTQCTFDESGVATPPSLKPVPE